MYHCYNLHIVKIILIKVNLTPTCGMVDFQIADIVVTICNRLGGLSFHVKSLPVKEIRRTEIVNVVFIHPY